MNTKKGFTLVELLIVIAILAVLGVAVVLVLNPAELIRRSRDATRISDLATLNSAIAFYLTEAPNPVLGTCSQPNATIGGGSNPPTFVSSTFATVSDYTVGGSGWVSINFGALTGGSPIASLPRDPVNTTTNYYVYACNQTQLQYEIDAKMESVKYSSGSTDVMGSDGGNSPGWYEVGNYLTL